MNSNELSTPRAALGLVAVATAAIAMGVILVLPAQLDSYGADPHTQAAARAAAQPAIGIDIGSARVDVPEAVDRGEHADSGCTTRGAQASGENRRKVSSRMPRSTSASTTDSRAGGHVPGDGRVGPQPAGVARIGAGSWSVVALRAAAHASRGRHAADPHVGLAGFIDAGFGPSGCRCPSGRGSCCGAASPTSVGRPRRDHRA